MISGIIYWEGSKYNWQVKTTSFPEVQLLENPMCPDVQSRKLSASGWHWTSVSTGYSWNSPWSSTSLWLMELISAPPVIRFRQKNSAAFSSKLSAHTVPQLPPILTIGGPVAPPIRCSVGSPHLISLTWWIGSESSYIIHHLISLITKTIIIPKTFISLLTYNLELYCTLWSNQIEAIQKYFSYWHVLLFSYRKRPIWLWKMLIRHLFAPD